jgi:ribose transport system permease protein
VKIIVYSIAGAFSGLAGLMLMSYQEQGDPTGAVGLELEIIAAVVIGGGSLSGGEGSVFGSLIGAVIMTVIRTGCQLMGWPTWVTQIVTGGVIVIAVAVDRIRHRKLA